MKFKELFKNTIENLSDVLDTSRAYIFTYEYKKGSYTVEVSSDRYSTISLRKALLKAYDKVPPKSKVVMAFLDYSNISNIIKDFMVDELGWVFVSEKSDVDENIIYFKT